MVIILLITIVIAGFLGFLFKTKNEMLKTNSAKEQLVLINEIEKNKSQIQFRSLKLDRYHFLKYNLSEALISQPDIKV